MAAYRRVYDSRHLQADCQEPDQLRKPMLCSRVWATVTFLLTITDPVKLSLPCIALQEQYEFALAAVAQEVHSLLPPSAVL